KACPILALYIVEDADMAISLAQQLIALGHGKHSAIIHSHNESIIEKFSQQLLSNRVIVNAPSIQAAMNNQEREQLPFASFGYQSSTNHQRINMELLHLKQVSNRNV